LLEKDNKVMIYVFPLEVATETFYQSMLDQWREGKSLDFPQPHQVIDRPLTMTDSILPEELKVERTDLISRAQAEWHFVVLSSKLYDMYKEELDDIKSKIDSISEYDDKLWQEAKTFWGKVQDQVREQNLFKEHSTTLKEKTNALFEKLKDLRKSLQNDFEKVSQEAATKFYEEIKEVDDKIEKGLGLKPLFEQMKAIQEKYYKAQLTKDDRKNVWDKLDATFKAMKDKRPAGNGGKPMENKTQSRYDGLISTITMMEKSIQRDKQDHEFQVKKIEQTDGQLEMQIRQAKLKMLEERINSKNEKLQDMYKVKIELEGRMTKDEARKASEAKKTEAKEIVKQKIAVDIEAAKEDRETMADLLENAAAKIKSSKSGKKEVESAPIASASAISEEVSSSEATVEVEATHEAPKEEGSFFEAITTTLAETFEDVVDTVKAIAEVAEDKIENAMDVVEDKMDSMEDKIEDVVEGLKTDDKSDKSSSTEDKEGDKA
jgi:chromosome segregation ATPase